MILSAAVQVILTAKLTIRICIVIKKGLILLLASLLMACASKPQVIEFRPDNYMVLDEAEFDYTEMVQNLHKTAQEFCAAKGKSYKVMDTKTGYGSTGAFGQKQGVQIGFICN